MLSEREPELVGESVCESVRLLDLEPESDGLREMDETVIEPDPDNVPEGVREGDPETDKELL